MGPTPGKGLAADAMGPTTCKSLSADAPAKSLSRLPMGPASCQSLAADEPAKPLTTPLTGLLMDLWSPANAGRGCRGTHPAKVADEAAASMTRYASCQVADEAAAGSSPFPGASRV